LQLSLLPRSGDRGLLGEKTVKETEKKSYPVRGYEGTVGSATGAAPTVHAGNLMPLVRKAAPLSGSYFLPALPMLGTI